MILSDLKKKLIYIIIEYLSSTIYTKLDALTLDQWLGLTSVVMVKSKGQLWNKTTTEVRFYISSLEGCGKRHNQVIRSHWSIENSLHWVLDVTFNEDASRIRQGHAAENMVLLRRLSVNLLKREPSKQSLKMKRYQAGIDNDFLMKVLAASAPS